MTNYPRYLFIHWPDVQELMELEGFEEHSAIKVSDDPDDAASYFVEEDWYLRVQSILDAENNPKAIHLPNRYQDNYVILVPVNLKKHKYKLVTNSNYVRVASQGDDIVAVDPEGGPYISIGYKVGTRAVTHIERSKKHNAYIITL